MSINKILNFTVPIGPFLCLVTITSVIPLSVVSGLYRRLCQIQGALDDQIRSDVEQYGYQSERQP